MINCQNINLKGNYEKIFSISFSGNFNVKPCIIGCGSSDEIGKEGEGEGEEEVEEKDPPKTKQQITILTGSTGGTYFALGGAMANTWTDYLDNIQVTSQPSGASVENINRLNAGEVELGISMNNIADNAWNGVGAFDKKTQNFRTIGVAIQRFIKESH